MSPAGDARCRRHSEPAVDRASLTAARARARSSLRLSAPRRQERQRRPAAPEGGGPDRIPASARQAYLPSDRLRQAPQRRRGRPAALPAARAGVCADSFRRSCCPSGASNSNREARPLRTKSHTEGVSFTTRVALPSARGARLFGRRSDGAHAGARRRRAKR